MAGISSIRAIAFCLAVVVLAGCQAASGPTACAQPDGPIKIVRDQWGVPHVRAPDRSGAAWGQGYVQAADRLLQIDLLRRTGLGTRAELLGADELELDRLVRTIGLPDAARASMAALDDEAMCIVHAFSGGINAFLDDMQSGANGARRPADLDRLDPAYVPPRWAPLDVVIVATAATFSLSSNVQQDLVLTASRLLLGDDRYERLVRFGPLVDSFAIRDPAADQSIQPVTAPATGPSKRTVAWPKGNHEAAASLQRLSRTFDRLRDSLGPFTSNNWVVAPGSTRDGVAFMASDPHGGISIPSSFHEIHLVIDDEDLNAYGIAVAGGPMIHIGHNGQGAWAFTNYGADVGDLYEEVPIDGDRGSVLIDGEPVAVEVRTEHVLVRGDGPVAEPDYEELEIEVVRGHGPVLNPVLPEPLPLLFGDTRISYKWVGAGPTREAQALANLIGVRTWGEFLNNASDWEVGAQNTVFASATGDIGYHATGLFPDRPWASADLNAIEPLPGDGSAEWQGFNPFDAIRTVHNPDWGFLASANADPAGLSADGDLYDTDYLGYVFDFGFRIDRIRRVLAPAAASAAIDWSMMESLQTDVRVGFAELLAPALVAALVRLDTAVKDGGRAPARDALANWDYHATVSSVGSSVFHETVVQLITGNLAPPVLAPLRPLLLGNNQVALRALVQAIETGDAEFFPDGVDAAILTAFLRGCDRLAAFFGSADVADWTWGELHVRQLDHPLGGSYNRGPLPAPGGLAVVNRSDFEYIDEDGAVDLPYRIVDGPDMRFIVELDGDNSVTRLMLPAGSSGDPTSTHYDDQLQLWLDGQYRTALYRWDDVLAGAVSTLTLEP